MKMLHILQWLKTSLLRPRCLSVRGHACTAWKVSAWGRRCLVCLSTKRRRRVSVTLQRFTGRAFIDEVLKSPRIESAFISVFHLSVSCNQSRVPSVGERLRSSGGAAWEGVCVCVWYFVLDSFVNQCCHMRCMGRGLIHCELLFTPSDWLKSGCRFSAVRVKASLGVTGINFDLMPVYGGTDDSVLSRTEEFMAFKDLRVGRRELLQKYIYITSFFYS